MKKIIIALSAILLLSSCKIYATKAISPESLLNLSSEKVAFTITDSESVDAIASWIKDDKPTEAVLFCAKKNISCSKVQEFLKSKSIHYNTNISNDGSNSVSLVYHRITARDCMHGEFGCATAANSIHMVADRAHFIRPPLSDSQDAATAVKNYKKYLLQ